MTILLGGNAIDVDKEDIGQSNSDQVSEFRVVDSPQTILHSHGGFCERQHDSRVTHHAV